MRRRTLNLTVTFMILVLTLSFITVLPATSQDTDPIISKLEKLRRMVEDEHPALKNKVSAVIHQIKAGAFNGALNKLQNDVKKSIIAWVDDQDKREDLIDLVDEIINLIKGIISPQPPKKDFEISADPLELEIVQGSSGTSTITITSKNGFSQEVALTNATSASGVTLSLNPSMVTPPPNGLVTSTLKVEVASDAEPDDYEITVTGTSGSLEHSVEVKLEVVAPDFKIEVEPNELTVEQGGFGFSTIKVTSLWGFNKRVDLSTVLTPETNKVTLSLDPSLVIPRPEGNTSTLTVTAAIDAEAQGYEITVIGKSDSLEHSVTILLEVTVPPPTPDFSIEASPNTLTIQQGDSDTSVITITSLGGFNQPVDLEVTSAQITGVTTTLNPTQVIPPQDSWAISILTIDVAAEALPDSYEINVTGQSDTLTHSLTISVQVTAPPTPPSPDFSIHAAPAVLTIEQGDSGTSTIIVASMHGFNQAVSLAITSGSIPRVTLSLNPVQVTPSANGFATSTLSVSVGKTATPNDYEITVAGTDGTLTRTTSISLKIISESTPPKVTSVFRIPEQPSYNQSVKVYAAVTDEVSGVEEVILNYSHGTITRNMTMTSVVEGSYVATIQALPFNTQVEYRVYATDKAHNWATSSVHSYVVTDPHPPVIGIPSWSPLNPAADEEITINVTVTEPLDASGVKEVLVWYKNKTTNALQSLPMTLQGVNWTVVITHQSDTTVEFFVEASDNADNVAESETLEFTVAAPPGIPLAWILAAIALILAGSGGATYYIRRRRKKSAGSSLVPTASSMESVPPPPPAPASAPMKKSARRRVKSGVSARPVRSRQR